MQMFIIYDIFLTLEIFELRISTQVINGAE